MGAVYCIYVSKPVKGRRRCRVRTAPLTKSISRLAQEAKRHEKNLEVLSDRPRTRADCVDGPRPCPWVGCSHHLYLDVNPENGSIKFNFPDIEPWDLETSCSLDVSSEEGATLDEVGDFMNLSRERIRQIEVQVLEKLADSIQRLVSHKPNKGRS